jgi:hypothetical protein
MKALKMVWIYGWAYIFVVLEKLDKLSDWIAHQVDTNDYLAGFVFALTLFAIPYLVGIIDIVVR